MIQFSQISNLEKIAEGGYGIIYKATWVKETVAIKKFKNSQNLQHFTYFFNEVISFYFSLLSILYLAKFNCLMFL